MRFLQRRTEPTLLIEGEDAHTWWVAGAITAVPQRRRPDAPLLPRRGCATKDVTAKRSASPLQHAFDSLDLDHTADWTTIATAYRTKAKQCHPDFSGDDSKMIELNEAYAVLRRLHHR